jgi:WD40 repeat protein
MAEESAADAAGRFVNPYVGPKPFAVGDRERFHGRDTEIRELTSLLIAHREVVLYSPSGAGKTSLLMAGVFPRLQDRGLAVLPPVRVVDPLGRRPAGIRAVANIYAFNVLQQLAPAGTDPATLVSVTLPDYLASMRAADEQDAAVRLRILMLDQFEELFTKYPERWKEREPFLRQVADALVSDRRLRVLFAVREEYVGKLRPFSQLFPNDLRQWFQLDRLREDAALKAIVLPASAAGRTFAPGVAEGLITQLSQIRVRTDAGTVQEIAGEFVEPVQLQIVCRKVWDKTDPDASEITATTAVTGGVDTALREYYEAQLAEVSHETGRWRRTLRRWFERRFITDDGWRARVFEQNNRVAGLPSEIAEKFRSRYLLRSDAQGDVRWFELAHDRLLGPIQIAAQQHRRRELPLQLGAAAAILLITFFAGRFLYQRIERGRLDREVVTLATAIASEQHPETKLREALALTLRAYPLLDRMEQSAALKDTLQYAVNTAAEESTAASASAYGCVDERYPRLRQLRAAAVSADGRHVARSGTAQGQQDEAVLEIWDIETCTLVGRRSRSRQPDRLAVANGGRRSVMVVAPGALTVLDAPSPAVRSRQPSASQRTKAEVATLQVIGRSDFEPGLVAVALGATGKYFATTAWDGTATVWNTATRDARWSIPPPTSQSAAAVPPGSRPRGSRNVVWDAALNSTETALATAHDDGSVGLWDAGDGRSLATLRGHTKAVRRVAFSPSGDLLATASWDTSIRIWDVPGGRPVRILNGHTRPVNSVAFSPSGQELVSAASDGTVRIWDLKTGKLTRTIKEHKRSVRHAVFSHDGSLVASAGADRRALISDPRNGSVVATLAHTETVWSIAFSPDASHIATASEDGTARVWERRTGTVVAELSDGKGRSAPLADVRFANGDTIVTVGSDDTCRWWNWRTQRESERIWGHGSAAVTGPMSLDPTGTQLAVVDRDSTVRVLDVETQKVATTFQTRQGAVSSVTFDSTGKLLVTAGSRPGLRVWDLKGATVGERDHQNRAFDMVATDADGSRVVAAGSDGPPILWMRDRQTAMPLAASPSTLLALAVSPRGDLIAAATEDDGLLVWSAATGSVIAKNIHPARVIGFSEDGRWLAIVSSAGVRRLDTRTFYEPDLPRLMAKAFERLPGGTALNEVIGLALRGEIPLAIKHLEELSNEQERQTATRLQLLAKLQSGTFTPLDLRTYFE